MNNFTKLLTASTLVTAVSIMLTGCGESPSRPSEKTLSADDGHAHTDGAQDDHDGHDHADDAHDDHDESDGHDHGEMRSLGSVEIAGTTLAVTISDAIDPSTEVNLELEVTSGPTPAMLRFWIGDEAGTGALKSKADAHDNHFHGHTDAPANVTGTSLWIEIENADGTRSKGSIALE